MVVFYLSSLRSHFLQTERLSPYIANSDRYAREIVALGDRRAGWPEDVGGSLFTIATVCLTPRHTKRPEMDQVSSCDSHVTVW